MPVRSRSLVAACLAAVLALGACQESGFDERKETEKPLKVQHVLGETKVPGQAEAPLTLSAGTLDDTLALGVRPVAAALPGGKPPRYLRSAADVPTLPPATRASLTDLEAEDPDLILGTDSGQGRLYPELSRIAPTVITEAGGGQWKLNLRLVGEALGRTNDAEALLSGYDAEAARVRRAIGRRLRVAVARTGPDGLVFARRDSFAGTILADAGLRRVTSTARADVTLLSGSGSGSGSVDGRVIRVDAELWWGDGGSTAGKAALAELSRALAR